jgi:hypothetical protein
MMNFFVGKYYQIGKPYVDAMKRGLTVAPHNNHNIDLYIVFLIGSADGKQEQKVGERLNMTVGQVFELLDQLVPDLDKVPEAIKERTMLDYIFNHFDI